MSSLFGIYLSSRLEAKTDKNSGTTEKMFLEQENNGDLFVYVIIVLLFLSALLHLCCCLMKALKLYKLIK